MWKYVTFGQLSSQKKLLPIVNPYMSKGICFGSPPLVPVGPNSYLFKVILCSNNLIMVYPLLPCKNFGFPLLNGRSIQAINNHHPQKGDKAFFLVLMGLIPQKKVQYPPPPQKKPFNDGLRPSPTISTICLCVPSAIVQLLRSNWKDGQSVIFA